MAKLPTLLLPLVLAVACASVAVVEFKQPVIRVSNLTQLKALEDLGFEAVVAPKIGSALYQAERPSSSVVPVAISIDDLDISAAPIDAVGVTGSGEMEIPEARRVGWYSFGPAPGEPGSAVLAAHIASGGIAGVFRHLDRLVPGDRVKVSYSDGSQSTYRVDLSVSYGKQELPFGDLFDRRGVPRLVLITCGGDFNSSLSSYEDNLVVYATRL